MRHLKEKKDAVCVWTALTWRLLLPPNGLWEGCKALVLRLSLAVPSSKKRCLAEAPTTPATPRLAFPLPPATAAPPLSAVFSSLFLCPVDFHFPGPFDKLHPAAAFELSPRSLPPAPHPPPPTHGDSRGGALLRVEPPPRPDHLRPRARISHQQGSENATPCRPQAARAPGGGGRLLPPAFQGGWLTGGLSPGSTGTPAPSKKDAPAPKRLRSLDARPALPSTLIAGAVSGLRELV
ncbi:uncharacterized protein LOC132023011 [Mustela nigripes]|uniref:uncharacterized protein LOC132023011 n=1 Tax=Mustela nigripes TaxID=77151 RepID=UPI0028159FD8|nr:uncharacterized protein LOC132023011 [Mustela nigripes]